MEEILSSIKRIISEEDAPAPRRGSPVRDLDDADVLELTDTVPEPQTMHEPETASFEPVSAPSAEEAPALAAAPSAPPLDHDALLSAASTAATRQALAALSKVTIRAETPPAENTLEGLVRDLLRPLLREWLDANLPRIVQATVDREVARLSGRG